MRSSYGPSLAWCGSWWRAGFWPAVQGRVMDGERRHDMSRFFFQAEDGIRDYKVTGVQTCALPISYRSAIITASPPGQCRASRAGLQEVGGHLSAESPGQPLFAFLADFVYPTRRTTFEIGRASCRERV